MTIRTIFTIIALLISPTLALAAECAHQQNAQTASCAAGQVYDSKLQECVPVTG